MHLVPRVPAIYMFGYMFGYMFVITGLSNGVNSQGAKA